MRQQTDLASVGALFDLDGVLIDSEGSYTQFWQSIDQRFPTGIQNFAQVIKGTNLNHILTYFSNQETCAQVVDALNKYQSHMSYEFFPGAIQLITKLKKFNIPMAIVTSSDQNKMQAVYQQHPSLPSLFDTIITGDMVKHTKPHPECYLTAARAIGCKIEQCYVFEDSIQGIQAGRSAGAKVVGLATTNPMSAIAPLCDLAFNEIQEITLEEILINT